MPLILDDVTKSKVPGAGSLFFDPPYKASACFNGSLPKDRVQKVHINPPKAVETVQNKADVMKFLTEKGYPVTPFIPRTNFGKKGEMFELENYLQKFNGNNEQDLMYRSPKVTKVLDDPMDILSLLGDTASDRAILQSLPQGFQTFAVSAMPHAAGHKLPTASGKFFEDGVLSNNLPAAFREKKGAADKLALDVLEDADLDYGTVTFSINPQTGEIELLDIFTNLVPMHVTAIRAYMDILNKAYENSKKGRK